MTVTRDDGYVALNAIVRMVHPILIYDTVEFHIPNKVNPTTFTDNFNNFTTFTRRENIQDYLFNK